MKVEIDSDRRIITIQGVKYAFELFNGLGLAPAGTVLRIENRADGAVTLSRHEPPFTELQREAT